MNRIRMNVFLKPVGSLISLVLFVWLPEKEKLRNATIKLREDTKDLTLPNDFEVSLTYIKKDNIIFCDEEAQIKKQMNPCEISTDQSGCVC